MNKLLNDQITKIRIKRLLEPEFTKLDPKAVFLVGGFGSSLYVRDSLKRDFPKLEVIQPDDAWSAIAKGAVLSLMTDQVAVTSNVSKKHWGVSARSPYNEREDAGQPKMWDPIDGVYTTSTVSLSKLIAR